jgi:hypothetical protein
MHIIYQRRENTSKVGYCYKVKNKKMNQNK